MKKIIIILLILLVAISIYIHTNKKKHVMDGDDMNYEYINEIEIEINNKKFILETIDNSATREIIEMLKTSDIDINMKEYGGFEIVGDLGFDLERNDINMTTSPGDVVLYQGNQIVIFYGSNTWSYTKLGHIKNTNEKELKDILTNNNQKVTLKLLKK